MDKTDDQSEAREVEERNGGSSTTESEIFDTTETETEDAEEENDEYSSTTDEIETMNQPRSPCKRKEILMPLSDETSSGEMVDETETEDAEEENDGNSSTTDEIETINQPRSPRKRKEILVPLNDETSSDEMFDKTETEDAEEENDGNSSTTDEIETINQPRSPRKRKQILVPLNDETSSDEMFDKTETKTEDAEEHNDGIPTPTDEIETIPQPHDKTEAETEDAEEHNDGIPTPTDETTIIAQPSASGRGNRTQDDCIEETPSDASSGEEYVPYRRAVKKRRSERGNNLK